MRRDLVPFAISRLIGDRPVRWGRSVGDYEGRDRTLEVFNADPTDQRALLDRIDQDRGPFEEAAGGPLIIIFHSTAQSKERYADFVDAFSTPAKGV